MRYNFYTVFDKGFLAKGLVSYDSVKKHCPEKFRYFVLCLDNEAYKILNEMALPSVILLTLNDIEDGDLREAKKTRTISEYSWTLKPSVATYLLKHHPDIETLMYLDSDLYFYSSIAPIYKEFMSHSILLFPHRLPAGSWEKESVVGKYNAGMIMFRNDEKAKICLEWWRKKCNAWCYRKPEPGKLGDQKYLDYFEEQFDGVKVLENKGVDVAPWNMKNYRGNIKKIGDDIFVDGHKLINFHFSSLSLYYPPSKILPNGPANSYGYIRTSIEKKLIYDEYIDAVYKALKRIQIIHPGFTFGTLPRPALHKQLKEMVEPAIRAVGRRILRLLTEYRNKIKTNKQKIMTSQENKQKIMVTGGLGFIGSNFVTLALSKGYHVINVDKKTYAARTDLDFDNNPNYEFIYEDISKMKHLPKGIEFIVNFAAESHVDNSLASNRAFFESNVGGVYNILELLKKEDASTRPTLIHISTDEVYGDRLEGFSVETDTLKPSNPYSATKAAADQLVFGWGRSYGIPYRICRSSNNYGYGQYAEKLIPRTIKYAYKGLKMEVHGDGSYQREWTHVEDNCAGIMLVMEKGSNGEIYNISSGEVRSNLEVVKSILKAMGKPDNFFTFVKNRQGQDLRYAVNPAKVKRLGWEPKNTLASSLPRYLELCEVGRVQIQSKKPILERVLHRISGN